MPRSGGEYVYNSRIIHPVYGIAQSFGDAAIWLMWLYVLAPLAVDPGLTMTFNYLGWSGAANWLTSATWHTFLIATHLQRHRLPVRGLRHQDLRPGAEDRHVLRHRRLRSSSASCSPSRRAPSFISKWNAAAAADPLGPPTTPSSPRSAQQAGQVMPTHTELGRHLRHHGRHVVAVRLRLLDRLHRRRGQAPRQADHLANIVRHPRAVRVHDLDRHRALQDGRLPVPERLAWNDNNGGIAGLDGQHAARHQLHRPRRLLLSAPAAWYTKIAAGYHGLLVRGLHRSGGWRFRTWPSRASCSPGAWTAWARSGSPTSTRASRARSRTTSSASSSGEALLVLYYTLLHEHDAEHRAHRHAGDLGVHPDGDRRPATSRTRSGPRASGTRRRTRSGRFLGLPVVVWGAAVDLVYLGILLYYFVFNAAAKQFTGPSVILFVGVWVARHHLVLRLERLQQGQVRHGHLGRHLRRAASGVT